MTAKTCITPVPDVEHGPRKTEGIVKMADSEEREALQQASLPIRMAAAMEAQLAANGHKSGWENMSSKWLLNRLRQETGELRRAIEERRPAVEIWSEAADVANFAAMLAANEQEQDDG